MLVFIPGSIPPVRFGPGGTDPAEISIPAVTYTYFLEQLRFSTVSSPGADIEFDVKKGTSFFKNRKSTFLIHP